MQALSQAPSDLKLAATPAAHYVSMMLGNASSGSQAIERSLALLAAIVTEDGQRPAARIAADIGLAPSTARRMLAMLERHGLVECVAHGRYAGGLGLQALAKAINPHRRLIETARPFLRRLAQKEGYTAHLGVYDDNDMVTYLIKEGDIDVFTREGAELEAYCTGIGKALLAQLPIDRLESYLQGTFVRLTAQTVCDPSSLRDEVENTRQRGYAVDDREISEEIACIAIPIPLENCLAALSLSGDARTFPLHQAETIVGRLSTVAKAVSARMTQPEGRETA